MTNELSRKQRLHFFLLNVAAFAAIFLALGFIILQLLQSSAYRQTDESLKQMAENADRIKIEIDRYQEDNPFLDPGTTMPRPPQSQSENGPNNRFNSQVVLWSADGNVLNKDVLGARFNELQNLKLDTEKLNAVTEIKVASNENSGAKLTFHSITISLPDADHDDVAYVQFLENTDQIAESMSTFRTILILCMVVFWLLSIAISYFISKQNMKPVLAAWQKQQEFVENASHELRTPLTIIQNSLQRLFTKPNRTILEESESIAQALNETRRLNGLTTDLLTIARSDANEETLDRQSFSPETFIHELIKPFEEIAQLEDKHLLVENFAKVPVTADEGKIHQLLVILLDNALKYTVAGDRIVLQSEISGGDNWLLEVKNSGPSIPDDEKKQIFERFHRTDPARGKETGGYGLGLAIAKQIVTAHKGKITVHDWQPQGVSFRIKLPIK